MPQTLLAFLAMMVATLAAFNQQTASLRSQEAMVKSELEIMANAVALDEMEIDVASEDWGDLMALDDDSGDLVFSFDDKSVTFTHTKSAQYVDDTGNPSGSPTEIVEVTITVSHSRYSFPLVIHSRMFMD